MSDSLLFIFKILFNIKKMSIPLFCKKVSDIAICFAFVLNVKIYIKSDEKTVIHYLLS